MANVKIDNMEFEWNTVKEFKEVKEMLTLLKTMGVELERIKAANQRIAQIQTEQIRTKREKRKGRIS